LRKLADAGKTIIAVIHQPSQHVFGKFDDLLLVTEGKQAYFGPVSNVRAYMEEYGCQAESLDMGTAEHVLDCITRMPIEKETVEQANERVDRLTARALEQTIDLDIKEPSSETKHVRQFHSGAGRGPQANLLKQFRLLLRRSLREVLRGKSVLILKAVQQISTALIYGSIYSLGSDQASIQDRFGLLSLIAIGASNVRTVLRVHTRKRRQSQMLTLPFVFYLADGGCICHSFISARKINCFG
jgi:hypothetical protein